MNSVYLETTIIGHLAGRIVNDPLVATRQTVTRKWWEQESHKFLIYVSDLVFDECSSGNPTAAAERLNVIAGLDLLIGSQATNDLALGLIQSHAIPATEPRDAFHIAIACTNGIEYLLTWNFKHIANATMRKTIEDVCRQSGYEPPTICTPDELLGI